MLKKMILKDSKDPIGIRNLFAYGLSVFLLVSSLPVSAGEWPTVSEPGGLVIRFPHQLDLADYENHRGRSVDFHENPLFAEQVKSGSLPGVSERLPQEPLVILPYDTIGHYGGRLHGLSVGPESGTSEIAAWRQANLVRFSDDTKTIVPNVVKAWKWNEDYTEITFFLRKGHRWSDGALFTADDVVFYMNDIILNKEIHKTTPAPWNAVGPIASKIDETTVTFIFRTPYPSLLFYLGGDGSYFDPYAPKHYLSRFHIKYNPDADKQAVANGFKNWEDRFNHYWNKWRDAIVSKSSGLDCPTLESHILIEEPTLEKRIYRANPYYFKIDTAGNQLPYIDYHEEHFVNKSDWPREIISGRIQQKSQNMPLDVYPLLRENQEKGGYTLQLPPTGAGPAILFNKTHPDPVLRTLFSDPRFNFAMSLAINRDEINRKFYLGLCSPQQALPQGAPFVTDADKRFMAEYDPVKAKGLLAEMGLKKGADGFLTRPDGQPLAVTWEYTLQYVGSGDLPALIAGYWEKIGIKTLLKESPTKIVRGKQIRNELDITNEWMAPFEQTLFSTPVTFMPPYGIGYPVMGIPWKEWRDGNRTTGEEPPLWVKNLWELGDEFATLVPGSEWYQAVGKEIIRINLENLSVIGTLAEVPLVTVVSNQLANVPKWTVNSYFFGYSYPYRADQWYFK